MRRLKVAILMGGPSSEHEVSLMTGRNVLENLDKGKYKPIPIFITKEGTWIRGKEELKPREALYDIDIVFNALHGEYGEDGTVQAVLDYLKIPYTGSGVFASRLGMNKALSRSIFKEYGLPVPRYILLNKEDWICGSDSLPDFIKDKVGIPCVVKPNNLGSSVGISIVDRKENINFALSLAFEKANEAIIEEYIKGIEITCGVLENGKSNYKEKSDSSSLKFLEALPVTQIIPPDGRFFDYEVKYNGTTQEITPALIDERIYKQAQEMAKIAHYALKCKGYSRTDMIIKLLDVGSEELDVGGETISVQASNIKFPTSNIYILEINTLPGLTKESLLPKAAQTAGLNFSQLLDRIIQSAI